MSIRKRTKLVKQELEHLGLTDVRPGYDGHGPCFFGKFYGHDVRFGYDSSPKAEYTAGKTRTAIRRALIQQLHRRGLPLERAAQAVDGHG